jgi:hypothetical protein
VVLVSTRLYSLTVFHIIAPTILEEEKIKPGARSPQNKQTLGKRLMGSLSWAETNSAQKTTIQHHSTESSCKEPNNSLKNERSFCGVQSKPG